MRVSAFLLGNDAHVVGTVLNVAGGGWDHYSIAEIPAVVRGYGAGVIEFDAQDVPAAPILGISVRDQDGQVLGSSASILMDALRVEVHPDVPARLPFALPFSARIDDPPPFSLSVVLSSDAEELAVQSFILQTPS